MQSGSPVVDKRTIRTRRSKTIDDAEIDITIEVFVRPLRLHERQVVRFGNPLMKAEDTNPLLEEPMASLQSDLRDAKDISEQVIFTARLRAETGVAVV